MEKKKGEISRKLRHSLAMEQKRGQDCLATPRLEQKKFLQQFVCKFFTRRYVVQRSEKLYVFCKMLWTKQIVSDLWTIRKLCDRNMDYTEAMN